MYGVIGCGVVGSAIIQGLLTNGHSWWEVDLNTPRPNKDTLAVTTAVFLSLPTNPSEKDKGYDLGPLVSNLNWLIDSEYQGVVVLVSTVSPDDADFLVKYGNKKGATYTFIVSPEFLTAKNATNDLYYTNGGVVYYGPVIENVEARLLIEEILSAPRSRFPYHRFVNRSIAECCLLKTWRNVALAQKLLTAKMIYFTARNSGISATASQDLVDEVFDDKRLKTEKCYSKARGEDGSLGFAGACLPKDLAAMILSLPNNAIRNYLEAAQHLNNMLRTLSDPSTDRTNLTSNPRRKE